MTTDAVKMQRAFDNAQYRYDTMLPEDPPIFRCAESGESNEDCWMRADVPDHECEPEDFEPDYERDDDFEPYDWSD